MNLNGSVLYCTENNIGVKCKKNYIKCKKINRHAQMFCFYKGQGSCFTRIDTEHFSNAEVKFYAI